MRALRAVRSAGQFTAAHQSNPLNLSCKSDTGAGTSASMKRVIALLASLALSGCISSREVSFQKRTSIPAGSTVGVITPADGVYMEDEYPKSGTVVARKLVAALVPYFPASSVVTPGTNGEYMLKPQILHWEDRATEWSAKPDRVKVSLPLYKSGRLVGSALV